MNKRIIVTGAGGQLGRELQMISTHYPEFEFIFLTRQELAIENKKAVLDLFGKLRPSYCINCAAYTAVDKAETEQETAFLINSEAVGNLAAACLRAGSKLVHISTDYVFNGICQVPYQEEDATDPVNLYGASKLAGEKQALQYAGLAVIIRTSWVYSAFGNNFVKTMKRLMKERESLNVVNDQCGSPTYAADLAGAILEIIKTGTWHPGIYHYSNEGVITWYEFAVAIKELTGSPCRISPIPTSAYPTPAKRPGYSALDKEKIKTVYSIVLRDWKKSLKNCIIQMDALSM